MAEAFRSGLDAVEKSQLESALSLGLTNGQAMRHVHMPQAAALAVPALAANVIFLVKETSVFSINALLDGRGDAFLNDNTEVLAWAPQNPDYGVGIESLGNLDTIAPAVQKGNTTLLNWINEEIKSLVAEQFFHADYAATLASVYVRCNQY
jgi:ABC-type amino acid transport substrate-binding protein